MLPATTPDRTSVWPFLRRTPWPSVLTLLLGFLFVSAAFFTPPAAYAEDEAEESEPIARDPATSKEFFEEGELKREERLWDEAATAFWKAVDADLENYRAHARYQETALAAGDPIVEMKVDYDKFVDEYPSNLCLKLHRARLDPPEERLPALEKLQKSYGKNPDVFLELGRAQLALKDTKAAVGSLERAAALKVGDRPDVLLLLAEALWQADKGEDAVKRLDAAVNANAEFFTARLMLARFQLLQGAFEASAKNADVVIQQRPTFIAAFLIKGEALSSLAKDDDAREVLKNAYRITQAVPDVTIALADLWGRLETDAAYKEATTLYEKVIAVDEENWRALYGLAWVLERQEKYAEAVEKYREVLQLVPESVAAVNSVGFCLLKEGRVTESQVQFKRALDMDREFVTALANLGATYDLQAKYKDAIKIYEKILKMKGQKENIRALINCAFDHEALGAFPKATALLERAHKVLPEDANIVVWLGDNYYFQKKWKEAEQWYQQAISMDEKSFFAWRGLGLTLGHKRRWEDATNALERAKKLKPDDLDMYVILGDIYYQEIKDLKSALDNYQEYMQRGGTDPEVQDAILQIKKALEK